MAVTNRQYEPVKGHDDVRGDVGATDYYSVLLRAVTALDPNTAEARSSVYDRARRVLIEQLLRAEGADASASRLHAERSGFEVAVERIEAEFAYLDPAHSRTDALAAWDEDALGLDGEARSASRLFRPAVWSVLGIAVAAALVAAGYAFLANRVPHPSASETGRIDRVPETRSVTHAAVGSPEELEPGMDGGSTDAGLPYYYRRQPVYYRTVYSLGTVLIDRSQRFLYLVQPSSVALRYGIGVGGECGDSAGLLRITRKEEWPAWVPSPALLKRRSYPTRLAGGPGNPLGARVLFLNDGIGIHGTNAPKSIGHAVSLGCFRMVNDDVVDLYQRVPTGTGVVVVN
jgi:lipoprotein-anchoring transpeptidase ErfK/SrfK